MGMEGINWGEVYEQCGKITSSFYDFYENYIKTNQKLFDDLSNYWASGNAIAFGDRYGRHVEENASWIKLCEDDIVKMLNAAGWIYASTFNTTSHLFLNAEETYADPHTKMNNPFKEKKDGHSGMNKNVAQEIIDQYEKDINGMVESFASDICGIEVSILDNQNEQKDAFKERVLKMCKKLYSDTDQIIAGIRFESNGEINRLEWAKQQTVNTFNA